MKAENSDYLNVAMQRFARFTNTLVEMGDWKDVKKSLMLIENLLMNGEPMVQHAVRRVYIPILSEFLDSYAFKGVLFKLMPFLVKKECDRVMEEPRIKTDISEFIVHLN